jgi:2-keto-4-pentenoate hydratase/2-oxohepta-3-ene-1,7-dioic acid hydratase in catechol pathway
MRMSRVVKITLLNRKLLTAMKLINFNQYQYGLVKDDKIYDLTQSQHVKTFEDALQWISTHAEHDVERLLSTAAHFDLKDVQINSPVPSPGKVVAAPINYRAHIEEMKTNGQAFGHVITDIRQAGLFLKASSSVVGPSQGIAQRFLDRRTDHEIELCVVIGKRCDHVKKEEALSHVAGYCLGLDITIRGPEDRSFRKSLDSYTVLGPWMTTHLQDANPQNIDLELKVNEEVRQKTSTQDMVMSVVELIEYASAFYTLYPGDVIMTGTPQGVGPIRPGDTLHAKGSGLGEMSVLVRAA